jgi:hypothetical protein
LLGEPLAFLKSGCEQSQQDMPLLDHLVGAGEQRRRDLLNWQVGFTASALKIGELWGGF